MEKYGHGGTSNKGMTAQGKPPGTRSVGERLLVVEAPRPSG